MRVIFLFSCLMELFQYWKDPPNPALHNSLMLKRLCLSPSMRYASTSSHEELSFTKSTPMTSHLAYRQIWLKNLQFSLGRKSFLYLWSYVWITHCSHIPFITYTDMSCKTTKLIFLRYSSGLGSLGVRCASFIPQNPHSFRPLSVVIWFVPLFFTGVAGKSIRGEKGFSRTKRIWWRSWFRFKSV